MDSLPDIKAGDCVRFMHTVENINKKLAGKTGAVVKIIGTKAVVLTDSGEIEASLSCLNKH